MTLHRENESDTLSKLSVSCSESEENNNENFGIDMTTCSECEIINGNEYDS